MAKQRGASQGPDLFDSGPAILMPHRLSTLQWPDPARIPVNHAKSRVRDQVWSDLCDSEAPYVVTGFASLEQVLQLVSDRFQIDAPGSLSVLFGTEPMVFERVGYGVPADVFTDEVRRYWTQERGISLRLSGAIVQTLEALRGGRIHSRFIAGNTRLHAKVYVGDRAATLGSSNFTANGLRLQFEANARFEAANEPERFRELRTVADNYWEVAQPWDDELVALLENLLRFTTWQEALARACADLLDGQWAAPFIERAVGTAALWPSQRAGIAQALWVVEALGSVLVADATGSGKTRMGAHLALAVKERLRSTGRIRSDVVALVCPPAVEGQWKDEAVSCGLGLTTVSQGLLSREGNEPTTESAAVRVSQVLAIDEAHNFLNRDSNRSRHVRESRADHVLMFTATPINRGKADLLTLVDLLDADNFDDDTLAVLDRLSRRRGDPSPSDIDQLRREIQGFTVRRTKAALNQMVDEDPDAYLHPRSGRISRYPRHEPHTYHTGETPTDQKTARRIRELASGLRGVRQLGPRIYVPDSLRSEVTDERWLAGRLAASTGLAIHNISSALRSSKAALLEHLVGTETACSTLAISVVKPKFSGDVFLPLEGLLAGPPPSVELNCDLPDWLVDRDAWTRACREEVEVYSKIHALALTLSTAREQAKAALIDELADRHSLLLAFDHHPITLAALAPLIQTDDRPVIQATGANSRARKQVRAMFTPDSAHKAIALCSDAMSEGLNLQGASAIVHLDLPTTLRFAEQRVGRVDRMDSPHDTIEAWWPDDSEAFRTTANERLLARNEESSTLLGSNLQIPPMNGIPDHALAVTEIVAEVATLDVASWDRIEDAFEPVRGLISGTAALLSPSEFRSGLLAHDRVIARVSPLRTTCAWAFFSVRGPGNGAPRWLLLDGESATTTTRLDLIAERLRRELADNPPSREFDSDCDRALSRFLDAAARSERELLPRKLRRALDQMSATCHSQAHSAFVTGDLDLHARWLAIARSAEPNPDQPLDEYLVAELWLEIVRPLLEASRQRARKRRYTLLRHINADLRDHPFDLRDIEGRLSQVPLAEPFERRVNSCILGIP